MVETHFFHYHLPLSSQTMRWRHLTRDFRDSHHHHCYCSLPIALIWCQTCLGLRFWVCIFIFGFGSLLVSGFVFQMSRERLTRPTSSATTIGDANIGGRWSLSFFSILNFFCFLFWFGSLFVWVLVNLWIGFSYVI